MSDFPSPQPVRFPGSALGRWVLRRLGWRVQFEGLPAQQGVLIVYPHTSNWDPVFVYAAKWALGLRLRYWAKASLFRIPLFGAWLRSFGGIPIERSKGAQGMVSDTVAQMTAAREQGHYFWLALAPEGTRKYMPGWRSGFYRVAVQAGVPLGLMVLNYRERLVRVLDFLRLSGDEATDMARIAAVLEPHAAAFHAQDAAPIRLLDSGSAREDGSA
jgi:1-acyl-sn-glycerol-3-phosphate acyltransferase